MKKIILLILSFSLTSCLYGWRDDDCEGCDNPYPVSAYEAVTIKRNKLDSSIKIEQPKDVVESAKIYIFNDLIFVTDKHKGFHIFDNSDPKNPVKKKFLNVPGATDIAIRNNTLFINQATDLVSISFNPSDYSIKLDKRIENVLTPNRETPDGIWLNAEEDEVIVGWKIKKVKR